MCWCLRCVGGRPPMPSPEREDPQSLTSPRARSRRSPRGGARGGPRRPPRGRTPRAGPARTGAASEAGRAPGARGRRPPAAAGAAARPRQGHPLRRRPRRRRRRGARGRPQRRPGRRWRGRCLPRRRAPARGRGRGGPPRRGRGGPRGRRRRSGGRGSGGRGSRAPRRCRLEPVRRGGGAAGCHSGGGGGGRRNGGEGVAGWRASGSAGRPRECHITSFESSRTPGSPPSVRSTRAACVRFRRFCGRAIHRTCQAGGSRGEKVKVAAPSLGCRSRVSRRRAVGRKSEGLGVVSPPPPSPAGREGSRARAGISSHRDLPASRWRRARRAAGRRSSPLRRVA